MKIKLRRLSAVCVALFGNEHCCAMNLDTSMMRPTKPPLSYELWNRVNELNSEVTSKDRIIEKQSRELSDKDKIIEKQNQQSEENSRKIEEKDQEIACLRAEILKLMEERTIQPVTSGLHRKDSYSIVGDSNLTLNYEEGNRESDDSELLGGASYSTEGDSELSMALSPNKDLRTDMALPPPSAEKNSRENKSCLPHFSPCEDKKSKIPPAPPPPPAPSFPSNGNTPPPPPPRNSLQNAAKKNREDFYEFVESVWAVPRKNLHERLEIERTAAKIVNIYLKKNPAKIISLILSYEEKLQELAEGLRDYEARCKQASNPNKSQDNSVVSDESGEVFKVSDLLKIVSEISVRLEDFRKTVNEKRLRAVSGKSGSSADKWGNNDVNGEEFGVKFSDISQRINRLAIEYFNKINKEYSSADLRGVGDLVIESVKIADSLSDLENLWEKSKNSSKFANSANTSSELNKAVKFAFDILHLEQRIIAELSCRSSAEEGESKSKNPSVDSSLHSPNGMERRCLELSLEYIHNTCRGQNQLSKLLKMRDHINSGLSQIKIPDNREHPLSVISKLPKDMNQLVDKIAELFVQAFFDETESSYSPFGTSPSEMAEDVVQGYSQIRNFANIDNSQGNSFRNFFKDKNLSGKFGDGVIELITVDRNLCPQFETLLRDLKNKLKISPWKKISSKSSEEISANLKNSEFLCLLKSSSGDILPLSRNASTQLARLKDRGCEVFEQIIAVSNSLKSIPSFLSNAYGLFGQKFQMTVSECVRGIFGKNPAFIKLIEGDFGFAAENGRIIIEIDEKIGKKNENFSLTNDDMFRIIFSVIFNRNLMAESNSKLFLSSENISKNELEEMAKNLADALDKVKESLEFIMSEDAFETEELREVFKADVLAPRFSITKQLDRLIEKIAAGQDNVVSGIENTVTQ